MVDENTQVQETQATEPAQATQPAAKEGFKVVYWSTNDKPFYPVLVPADFDLTSAIYPLIPDAPDASIKSPKYDWSKYTWIENEANAIGAQIANLNKNLATFQAQLQEQQKQTQSVVQDNTAVQKELADYGKMMVTINAASGKTQAMVAQLVQAYNNQQKTEATTETKEEGAN